MALLLRGALVGSATAAAAAAAAASAVGGVEAGGAAEDDLFMELRSLGEDVRWPKGEDVERPSEDDLRMLQRADAAAVAAMNPEERFHLRRAHVVVCEWLSRHQPQHAALRDRLMERAAERLKLWPSKYQWCEAWHEELAESSAPLHPQASVRERWPAVAEAMEKLEATILPSFVREHEASLAAAQRAAEQGKTFKGHKEHPEGLHTTGDWTVLNLWDDSKRCLKAGFPSSCEALTTFDNTLRAAGSGRLQIARLASLHPGTTVVAHTGPTNERLKVHCGLENPDGVQIRIANLSLTWQPGRCMLIDDSFEHEIRSGEEQRTRTILELKLEHPDLQATGYRVDEETGKRFPLKRPRGAEL